MPRKPAADGPAPETHEASPGCLIVRIEGDVDAESSPDLLEKLTSVLATATDRLVIDLSEVTFFDSAGIRCLLTLRRRAGDRRGCLRLVMPKRPGVRRALDLISIEQVMPVAESVEKALGSSAVA